jgi:hypothetical protein
MVGKGGKEMSDSSKTEAGDACLARKSRYFSYRNNWFFTYYLRKKYSHGRGVTSLAMQGESGLGFAAWFVVLFVFIVCIHDNI